MLPFAISFSGSGIRVRYRTFVARHEVAWELFFGGLAVVFVALAFVPVTPGSATDQAIYALEWLITGLFIAEFSSRLWAAESRRGYVRGHWIDLVSCIPPVRWARFFRLFRLLRLVRTFAGIGRAMTHVERLGNHHGLMWLILAWIAVMLLCAVGLFVVENGVNEAVDEPARRAVVGAHDDDDRRLRRRVPDDRRGTRRRRGADDPRHRALLDHHRDRHELPDRGRPRRSRDLAGQLERLAALHADGRVTDDEYRAAKAAVITGEAPLNNHRRERCLRSRDPIVTTSRLGELLGRDRSKPHRIQPPSGRDRVSLPTTTLTPLR